MLSDMRIAQGAVECAFPLRIPASRPQVSMRLRVEALQSGALRVTRTPPHGKRCGHSAAARRADRSPG